MLRTLRLQDYRCFDDHTVTFHPGTVVVGRNNAGKSTIVEALHLVAAVVNRKSATFTQPPADSELPGFQRCIIPRISHLGLNLRTAFHRYGDPPAVLTANFTGNATVTIYVGREGIHATIAGPKGWVSTSSGFLALDIPHINILPQVAPLQTEETNLRDEYINEHYYTRLSSRHFRNQILRNPEYFAHFKSLAEETWRGLRVETVQNSGNNLSMLVTDGDFAAEAAWMGHGLQMWLQTIWFVAKTPTTSTVVLDEPDVYMHPDLQRKLYRLVRARFSQSIIATHSVEIMAEADPADILVINNKRKRSVYANTEPGVQVLVDQLGGIHNVHLARLWNAKKVLLLEGKDLGILKTFHGKLFPNTDTPLDAIPNLSIGGWGGWEHAIGGSMALKNAVGDRITTYCIFDRDYHTSEELSDRYDQAQERGISLHIWLRKEIENYLLNPTVIARLIKQRTKQSPPTPADVTAFLLKACQQEKDTVFDAIANHLAHRDKSLDTGGANKAARKLLDARWQDHKLEMVSGKALVSHLNTWTQEEFKTSVGGMAIAKAFQANEIPNEMREFLVTVEEGKVITAKTLP
ncbi:MAG: AAA family ATPase [Acidobacteria bacterium]|nr:AAA family ATPase [Acidobacteriota bacterium]